MRNGKISAVVALLLINSVETINLQNSRQLNARKGEASINPDFESSMTLTDWKAFSADETL
jgi:hypothetical protein